MQLNTSFKHQLLIGFSIGIWLFIFAFVIKPFDDGTISFKIWLYISVGFGLIAFLCYALLSMIQKHIYQRLSKWNVGLEIIALLLFHLLFLVSTYIYYSVFLHGGYSFLKF